MEPQAQDPVLSCDEFRRRLRIAPREGSDAEMLRHRRCCSACDQWANQEALFERQLRRALEVDPPAGLEQRILKARNGRRSRLGEVPVLGWALAATLALAFGVGLWVPSAIQPPTRGIDDLVLEHLDAELEHLRPHSILRYAEVAPVLKQLGGEIIGGLADVSFAGICDLDQRRIAHLVVHGEQGGAVSLLFLPDIYLSSQVRVRSSRFSGVILPTDFGSLAVIGEAAAGSSVDQLARRVRGTIVWRT